MGVCTDYIVPIKQAENRLVQGVHRIPVWMQTREQMTSKHLRGHQSATGPLSSLGTYSALVPSYNSQKSRPQAIHLLKPQFLSLWLLVSGYPGLDYVPQIYTLNS